MNAPRAFTLVEMLVTLTLVAVLSSVAVVGLREVLSRDAASAEAGGARVAINDAITEARVGMRITAIGAAGYNGSGSSDNTLAVQVDPQLSVQMTTPAATANCILDPALPDPVGYLCDGQIDTVYPSNIYQAEDRTRLKQLLRDVDISGLRSELGAENVQVSLSGGPGVTDNTGGEQTFDNTYFDGWIIVGPDGSIIGGSADFLVLTDGDGDGSASGGEIYSGSTDPMDEGWVTTGGGCGYY